MKSWNCQFVFYGDDEEEALRERIIAGLEAEDLDFDPATVEVSKLDADEPLEDE